MSYFNTYFSKAGFTGNFTENSIVIVQNVKYFTSFNFAATRYVNTYIFDYCILGCLKYHPTIRRKVSL